MFLFDLDFYEPTQYVLRQVASRLRCGDLPCFDEAVDLGLRRASGEVADPADTGN
jgi:hypothetical protein